jgi:hypothetical protein
MQPNRQGTVGFAWDHLRNEHLRAVFRLAGKIACFQGRFSLSLEMAEKMIRRFLDHQARNA